MKKYTYITISKEERVALKMAIFYLSSNPSVLTSVLNILKNLLERSKHREIPNVKMQKVSKRN